MNVEKLVKEIQTGFAEVLWPYDVPAENLTPISALEVLQEIFLISDTDKHYELPRIMCVTITEAKPPLLEQLLCKLIEFLDVDFCDPERTNELLKSAKSRMFSSYSTAQSLAIWNWLTFIKISYELRNCPEALTSAIRYWGQRARN